MNKRGHLSTGTTFGALVGVLAGSGPGAVVVCTGLGGVAALAPDIDHHRATITRALPGGSTLSWLASRISLGVYTLTATSRDTPGAGGAHRGLTHTGVAGLVTGAAVWLLLAQAGVADAGTYGLTVTVGIIVHILGDALTAQGVPLVWPVLWDGQRWYPFRIPGITITGGGPAEMVITGLAWTATVVLLATGGPVDLTPLLSAVS